MVMACKRMRLDDVPSLRNDCTLLEHMPFNRAEVSKLVAIFGPSVFTATAESSNAPVSVSHVHLMHRTLFTGDPDTLADHYARMAKIASLLPRAGVQMIG